MPLRLHQDCVADADNNLISMTFLDTHSGLIAPARLHVSLGERWSRRWRLARDISGLGDGRRGRLVAWSVCLTMPLRMRIPLLSRRLVRLRLDLGGRPVAVWLSDGSELEVVRSILVSGEYGALDVAHARTIIDLGANIGIAAMWFRSLNPEARIIAVEPDPFTFKKLCLNVGHDPLVRCVNVAITPETGPVAFVNARHSWESRVADTATGDTSSARGITLDELMGAEGVDAIDILKVDIEGMEFAVLPGARCLIGAGQVIGELHPDMTDRDISGFVAELANETGLARVTGLPGHLFLLRAEMSDAVSPVECS
jgi:FkbM family methyltransferase